MRTYTLQYLTYVAPEEKHLTKIRNFPGIVVISECAYATYKMHAFIFEHESNDLTLNMFKIASPWLLFRGKLEKNLKGN
jgi:hypothetical protein